MLPPSVALVDAILASGATSAFYSSLGPNAQYFADIDKTVIAWESWNSQKRVILIGSYFHDTANGGAAAIWSGEYFVSESPMVDDDHDPLARSR